MGRTLLIGLGRWLQRWGDSLVERYQPVNPAGDLAEDADRAAPASGASAKVPPPHWVALVQAEAPWLLEDYVWPETGAYQIATEPSAATRTGRPGNEPGPSRRAPAAPARATNAPTSPVAASPLAGGRSGPKSAAAQHRNQAKPAPSPGNPWLRREDKTISIAPPGPAGRSEQSTLPSAAIEPSVDRARQAETLRTSPPAGPLPMSAETSSASPATAAATRRGIESQRAPAAAYRKHEQTARHRFEAKPAPRPAPLDSQPMPNPRQFADQTEAAGKPNRHNPPATSQRLIALAPAPERPQQPAPIRTNPARPADPVAFAHKPPPAARRLLGTVPAKPEVQTVPEPAEPAKPENWQRQNWPQLPDESADQFAQRCQRWPDLPDQFSETGAQTQRPAEPMAREQERNRRLAQEQRGLAWNE